MLYISAGNAWGKPWADLLARVFQVRIKLGLHTVSWPNTYITLIKTPHSLLSMASIIFWDNANALGQFAWCEKIYSSMDRQAQSASKSWWDRLMTPQLSLLLGDEVGRDPQVLRSWQRYHVNVRRGVVDLGDCGWRRGSCYRTSRSRRRGFPQSRDEDDHIAQMPMRGILMFDH